MLRSHHPLPAPLSPVETCELGPWSKWSACTHEGRTCGCKWGVETRVREVLGVAREEGAACPALLETRKCRMRKHCPGGEHRTALPAAPQPRGWLRAPPKRAPRCARAGGRTDGGGSPAAAGEPGCHLASILRPVALTVQFWRKPPSQAHVLSSSGAGAGAGCGAGGDPPGSVPGLAAPTQQPLRPPGTGRCPFHRRAGTGAGVSRRGWTRLPSSGCRPAVLAEGKAWPGLSASQLDPRGRLLQKPPSPPNPIRTHGAGGHHPGDF